MPDLQPPLKTTSDWEIRGARLERYMHSHIPLAGKMQVRVAGFDDAGLSLTAPLAPNINHERSAFGGSLASVMTLACWGYLWLLLEGEPKLHIVVNEAKLRYLKPVTGELSARCPAPEAKALKTFLGTLARRGKSRIGLTAEVRQGETVAALYSGSFVAYRENGR
ncbi:MAG TPA: YiiD C-terminal domain-containing protein [Gammaproteobacteria bacterium]|nr:YiiD C-terminal domain-containing protein [Gammaproteobacteria bacterium]